MSQAESVRISIVVPFYDEQENVSSLYVKITEAMDQVGEPYEMIFVDDGNNDDTYRTILSFQPWS
jgi:glycosyltransferase involved in cell wall biosynthesis